MAYELVDTDSEVVPFLNNPGGSGGGLTLELLNDAARSMIENYLDRHIVSRGSITEYHSVYGATHEIFTRQWPILTVSTIHEDTARDFAAASLLTETTDYVLSKPSGRILRVSSNVPTTWDIGWRAIKVVYTGGYASTALVDETLKYAALRLIALMWNEAKRQEIGYSSIADAQGNIQRLVPGGLSADIKKSLYSFRRMEQCPTGEVDA